jgi:hypothetical protein
MSVTGLPNRTSTPRRRSSASAFLPSFSGKVRRRRSAASSKITRALVGSIRSKSLARAKREISARAPASSTPVGPPPTTTKVRSASRRFGSSSRSASS